MSTEPVVVGVGLVTAVGLSAPETAASVRAATARFTESRIQDKTLQPMTLASVPEDALPPLDEAVDVTGLTARETRLLRLAKSAIIECVRGFPETESLPPLILALSAEVSEHKANGASFLSRLAVCAPRSFDPLRSNASLRGRAGGLIAIGHAVQLLLSGEVSFAIAGGIDSYQDLYVLGTLDRESRLKSENNLDGFIPGEGAAFVLLASRGSAMRHGLRAIARVSLTSVAQEPGHLYSTEIYRGEGLATALQQLVQSGAISAPIQEVYSSMNGERHWAKEWGVARLRSQSAFSESHGMHHPADCYGDLGAASGPALTALSALGISGGYRRSPSLVYASSDTGLRAAVIVAGE